MSDRFFDKFARDLADNTERRSFLQWSGAFLGGAFLVLLGGESAYSQGANDCARFCGQLQTAAARTKCNSDARQGTGACYQCGPRGAGGYALNPADGSCHACSSIANCGSCQYQGNTLICTKCNAPYVVTLNDPTKTSCHACYDTTTPGYVRGCINCVPNASGTQVNCLACNTAHYTFVNSTSCACINPKSCPNP